MRTFWFRFGSWRTGSPALHPPRASASTKDFLQARSRNGFSLHYRDTSDRLLPPLPPDDLHPRSRFSASIDPIDSRRQVEAEERTFHDVLARFGRIHSPYVAGFSSPRRISPWSTSMRSSL